MAVGQNIIFDPSKEELVVADVVLAVSVAEKFTSNSSSGVDAMEVDSTSARDIRLVSVRTIDPPSRLTHSGVPNALNTATGGSGAMSALQATVQRETQHTEGVWQAPRGGASRKMIAAMIQRVFDVGGVAEEVLDGLDGVELG